MNEFFNSDNIFLAVIAVAALAAAMKFFVEHVEEELQFIEEEIREKNKDNVKFDEEVLSLLSQQLNEIKKRCVNNTNLVPNIVRFIIVTLLGLCNNWLGRNLYSILANPSFSNSSLYYLLYLLVILKGIIIGCILIYGSKLLYYRKTLRDVQKIRKQIYDLFIDPQIKVKEIFTTEIRLP